MTERQLYGAVTGYGGLQPERDAGIKPARWLDYVPLGQTHKTYHGLMLAIALMVLWKVRKL